MELMDRKELRNFNKIGDCFKKENVVLATVTLDEKQVYDTLRKQYPEGLGEIPDEILAELIAEGIIQQEFYDVFYHDENGYTYFYDETPITIKGDNSDGNGTINNVVPVWDYFKDYELFEVYFDFGPMIVATTQTPLLQYQKDCCEDIKGNRK
jgi:hypothetical protein